MARNCHEKPERPQEGMIFWVNSGQFQNLSQGRQDGLHKSIKIIIIGPIKINQTVFYLKLSLIF